LKNKEKPVAADAVGFFFILCYYFTVDFLKSSDWSE